MFIVLMEMFINNYTLETYGALGVAAVAVVINVFEFVLYMSEGISEYEVVAVNDSIGKKSKESFEHKNHKTSDTDRRCCFDGDYTVYVGRYAVIL